MYKQKGTGRARHGSGKDPVFVGGGIAHGPHPRDYSLEFPKKMRRVALFGALTNRFNSDGIKFVDGVETVGGKTKDLFAAMIALSMFSKKDKKRKALLVTSKNLKDVTLAGRNIEGLMIKEANLLNALDVMTHRKIIMMKDAVDTLTKTFIEKSEKPESKKEAKPVEKVKKSVKKTTVKKAKEAIK
jgi:large subunit ribosomal protein L4